MYSVPLKLRPYDALQMCLLLLSLLLLLSSLLLYTVYIIHVLVRLTGCPHKLCNNVFS